MRLRLHAPSISLLICLPTFLFVSRRCPKRIGGSITGRCPGKGPRPTLPVSLSRGGIEIELGRAVEIELKGITASGESRNI